MNMADLNRIPEGVNIAKATGVVSCTREALNKLGDWCRANAGALAIAVFATTSANAVLAQSFQQNPEYDGIIVEAQKTGKDPLKVAQEKKKNGEWDIKRYIDFSKYNRNIQEQAVIIEDKKNNGKRQEGKQLDDENNGKRQEGKQLDQELIKNIQQILTSMQTLESAGKFGTKEIRDLNEMYNGNLPPEAKKIILQRFGKYIKGVDVAKL